MANKLNYSGPSKDPYDLAPESAKPARPPKTFQGRVVPTGPGRDVARARYREQTDLEQQRSDWLVPLCILGGCAVVWLLVGVFVAGIEGAAGMGIAFGITAVFNAVIGLVTAYAMAAMFGTGFGPFWIAILKLAAASTTAATAGLVPIGCFSFIVYIGVLAIMLQVLVDLEGSEAYWFIFFFVLVSIAASVGLGYLLADFMSV